jgi:hypothetical protein
MIAAFLGVGGDMRNLWLLFAVVVVGCVALSTRVPEIDADPGTYSGIHAALDCDIKAPGIQDVCSYPVGTTTIDVGMTVAVNTGTSLQLGSFVSTAVSEIAFLSPPDPPAGNLEDENPDFNNSLESGTANWNCGFPPPDNDDDADPLTASSNIACFRQSGLPASVTVTGDGVHVLLATVRYDVAAAGAFSHTLTYTRTEVGDDLGASRGRCGMPEQTDTMTCTPATIHVVAPGDDLDGDGIANSADNCDAIASADQMNSDRNFVDLPPTKAYDDATWITSDEYGDVCDHDDDNDGLTDDLEAGLPGPVCPAATAPTSPTLNDSDGDSVLDRAECALGTNPADAGSKPGVVSPDGDNDQLPDAWETALRSNPAIGDSDADGVRDGIEFRFYGSDPLSANTDGDVCNDGKEVASVNADTSANVIDQQQIAQHAGTAANPNYIRNFDVNKSGAIDVIDLQFGGQQGASPPGGACNG